VCWRTGHPIEGPQIVAKAGVINNFYTRKKGETMLEVSYPEIGACEGAAGKISVCRASQGAEVMA
jgi:hypothetical protein